MTSRAPRSGGIPVSPAMAGIRGTVTKASKPTKNTQEANNARTFPVNGFGEVSFFTD